MAIAATRSENRVLRPQYLHTFRVPPEGDPVSPTLPFRARVADFFAGAPDTTL